MAGADDQEIALGAKLRALREDRGLSLGKLSFAIWEATDGEHPYEPSFLGRVERGEKPVPDALLLLYGAVLAVSFSELPEFYLAEARRQLDEREVGLDTAVENLRRLEADGLLAADLLPLPAADELQRELEDQQRASAGGGGSVTPPSPRSRRSARRRAT